MKCPSKQIKSYDTFEIESILINQSIFYRLRCNFYTCQMNLNWWCKICWGSYMGITTEYESQNHIVIQEMRKCQFIIVLYIWVKKVNLLRCSDYQLTNTMLFQTRQILAAGQSAQGTGSHWSSGSKRKFWSNSVRKRVGWASSKSICNKRVGHIWLSYNSMQSCIRWM